MSKLTKTIFHQFLTPPKRGRKFKTHHKGTTKIWEVIYVIRKASLADYRYEVEAELIDVVKD